MALWVHCHSFRDGQPSRIEWPDGGALIQQPAIAVAMFSLIEGEYGKEREAVLARGK